MENNSRMADGNSARNFVEKFEPPVLASSLIFAAIAFPMPGNLSALPDFADRKNSRRKLQSSGQHFDKREF